MTDRCTFCRWQASGAIDLYCMYHWARAEVSGLRCFCGAPAEWVQRKQPLCKAHGGVFPVAKPGPYAGRR
jgi:hypothetical protein